MSHRLLRVLTPVAVMLVLMAVLLARAPGDKDLAATWMDQAQLTFTKEMNQVRVLWEQQKGNTVHWQGRLVAVNDDGWPLPPCEQLWQDFGLPLSLGGEPVQIIWLGRYCRFAIEDAGFDYWPKSGRIKTLRQGDWE
ncbi:hypothetical protein [Gallaecimonas mangrovi]|uniref:hypothetical protein n=1 Tax=Gallaecimonas mangrovi TaxID=2291597 RepID=UPI000E1FB533|nr:hypothetical protein [Gallaecimonas mangrovi]